MYMNDATKRLSRTCMKTVGTMMFAIVALGSVITTARPAGDDTAELDRTSIQSVYDQLNNAFAENRVDRMMAYLTDDFVQTDPQGHVFNKAATRRKFQGERDGITACQTSTVITNIAPDPGGEAVDLNMKTVGTGAKKILFLKVSGSFVYDMVAHDLWVQTPAGWRIKCRQMSVDASHTHPG